MSDDVPDLEALRGDRMASDAEYIEELEQLSRGQERENARMRLLVEGDEWRAAFMRIMKTIDGGRRIWSDPLLEQAADAVAELEAERNGLRAVVEGSLHAITAVLADQQANLDGPTRIILRTVGRALRGALDQRDASGSANDLAVNEALAARSWANAAIGELEMVEAERDRLRAVVAELCNDCNHPRADHAFRGKPDACAWSYCSCKGYVAEPVALDTTGVMGGRHLAETDQQSHGMCLVPGCGRPLDDAVHIDASETTEEEFEFYSDPANREPQGPPVDDAGHQDDHDAWRQYVSQANICPQCQGFGIDPDDPDRDLRTNKGLGKNEHTPCARCGGSGELRDDGHQGV